MTAPQTHTNRHFFKTAAAVPSPFMRLVDIHAVAVPSRPPSMGVLCLLPRCLHRVPVLLVTFSLH